METMEGILLTPPDRGTIIGRALWKPRFVVLGNPQKELLPSNASQSQASSTSGSKHSQSSTPKPQQIFNTEGIYLSIYKSKEDWEPVQQHSVASITSCHVQMLAHRKQGPHLPTLVVQISPDPTTDKLRKRRSSRTAGLTTTRDAGPTTLWFRPGDDRPLQDWARVIQPLIQPAIPNQLPMSPASPISPTFTNPFGGPRPSEGEFFQRPSGLPGQFRSLSTIKSPIANVSMAKGRPRTNTSDSPSLRSKKSDISSSTHASSMHHGVAGYGAAQQHYAPVLPADLPSPASTVGDYQGEFIEGWTSAQGRSSTLSSPVRGRESISSSQGQPPPSIDSSSPPAPRETILDRAFQLKYIPGSDREVPGEEKLTSLARFDALMREVEGRQKPRTEETLPEEGPIRSAWEEDDDSEAEEDSPVEEDDSDDDVYEHDFTSEGPDASRALNFLANRHVAGAQRSHPGNRASVSFDTDVRSDLGAVASIMRPHTSHTKSRPAVAQRTNSQPHFNSSPLDLQLQEEMLAQKLQENRQSMSSAKRLSLNDFTKRLSSTSSLLLVQTNASNGSSRGSSEFEIAQQTTPRATMSPKPLMRAQSDRWPEESLGWRGSVGVTGSEGGFM